MARARTVRPEFFQHEGLADCTHAARLLFIGLWTLADRSGRLEDRPKRLRAQLFPYEPAIDVAVLLEELASRGFVERYEAAGQRIVSIPAFAKHQRPHPKEPASVLPGKPAQTLAAAEDHGEPRLSTEGTPIPSGPSGSSFPSGPSGSTVATTLPLPAVASHGVSRDVGPRETWITPYATAWRERTGGDMAIAPALKPFSRLLREHGEPKVLSAWCRYLGESDVKFLSAAAFASKFGFWSGDALPPDLVRAQPMSRDQRTHNAFERVKARNRLVEEQR